ncbi:mitochondrial genome maintenance MGM101 [Atractiella rhizophila]|nr:mitochondrial genome maintenance MGM101 [Atractiella rhizophila]
MQRLRYSSQLLRTARRYTTAAPAATKPASANGATTAARPASYNNSTTSFPARAEAKLPSATYAVDAVSRENAEGEDWSTSFYGLSQTPFEKEIADILLKPIDPADVEMKPDGLIYLPEIKYRRILNQAFGPGGWGLAPRSDLDISAQRLVSREYALVCLGRMVGMARGEQEFFDPAGIPTAAEAAKSNALMRCCKDLGIASELWDPSFIRKFKSEYCTEVWTEHVVSKKKQKRWRRKDATFEYPYKEV